MEKSQFDFEFTGHIIQIYMTGLSAPINKIYITELFQI